MIVKEISYVLKDGRKALIRAPKEEEAQDLLNCLRLAAAETDFLLRYPEEYSEYTVENEKAFIKRVNESDNEAMLLCLVEGKIAGSCYISWDKAIKTRHRAHLSIALLRAFWNQGIGTCLMQELINIAQNHPHILQMELAFVEGNIRVQKLYEKLGFRITGKIHRAVRLKDGTLLNENFMVREIKK